MYYLYILECADKSLYTGITNDFSKRIKMHNNGKASKYTRARLPVNYVFMKKIDNKSDALKLEIKTKKGLPLMVTLPSQMILTKF